jgi:hypothetical protein
MEEVEEFSDERLKSWCIHCGAWIGSVTANVDHVPSRCLLQKPYPPHLPKVQVCAACNEGFSLDEEYLIAFLGAVLAGSADPARQANPIAARILQRSSKLRARIESARTEYRTLGGEARQVWRPEPDRVRRVVVKNARGHVYFEQGEPMLTEPARVSFVPLESMPASERADFEHIGAGAFWPEVGSRMMTRIATGQDLRDGWVVVQDGFYRYSVAQNEGMLVR